MGYSTDNSRTKNAKQNIFAASLNKIVVLLLPFVLRTVMIQVLAAEYLGVSSLFTSILQVLSISELGFSSAIVYSMYKPIAEKDTNKICALMNLYKKVYRVIGIVVLFAGFSLLPFLNHLVSGSYPADINIYAVYVLYLLNSSVSYFFFAYKTVLLQAHQKISVTSNINTIVSIVVNVLQIGMLLAFKNYYIYVALILLGTICNNIIPAYFATKRYPEYLCRGKLDAASLAKIKKQVVGLMIQKVCAVTRNSFDSIYISLFLGLTVTAIYTNYYMILTGVAGVLGIVTTSITAGVGNSVVSETVEKNYQDFKKFNFIYMLMGSWAAVCMLCLYQPFMLLWMGEDLLLSFTPVLLLVVYFYALCIGNIRLVYTNALGLYWQFRYRAIAESTANIFLNYFLGKYFGLNGIIVATLISLFLINYLYGSHIIFKHYFGSDKVKEYFKDNMIFIFVMVMVMFVTYNSCNLIQVDGYLGLFLKLMLCGILPAVLYFVLYFKNEMARQSLQWIVRIIKNR